MRKQAWAIYSIATWSGCRRSRGSVGSWAELIRGVGGPAAVLSATIRAKRSGFNRSIDTVSGPELEIWPTAPACSAERGPFPRGQALSGGRWIWKKGLSLDRQKRRGGKDLIVFAAAPPSGHQVVRPS